MARIPRFGSPGWSLLGGSLLLALLGLGSTMIGIASVLSPSSDRISDFFYLVVGLMFIAVAVFMFTAGLKYDDSPESLFGLATHSGERIAAGEIVNQLTPNERERLDQIKTAISCAPSLAEVLNILNRKHNDELVLANLSLQPIAFAIRTATTARYVKGVVLEALTWTGVIISIPFIFVIDLWRGARTVMYLALRLSRRARQYRARPDKILQTDARAPVLYLRSFLDEYGTSLESYLPTTSEEKLAKHYHRYGPVIAVGNPKEYLPLLGASRLYFDQDLWQAGVLYLMSVSQSIIIQAGIAPGLLWELGSVRKRFEPEKLVISFTAWEELDESTRHLHYLRFKKYAEELLGCELPTDIHAASHITFGTGWLPRPQSEFRYAIPSVRRLRGRMKKIGAAAAFVISTIITITVGRPLLQRVIETRIKPVTVTESPAQWNRYTLRPAPMSVDAFAEPQPVPFTLLEAEESDLYGYADNDLDANMGYLRFLKMVRVNGEGLLRDVAAGVHAIGITNLRYTTTKNDKGNFVLEGQFMKDGKEYKLRGTSFVKGQEVWFIRVFYPSNSDAAGARAQHMLDSLKEERDSVSR